MHKLLVANRGEIAIRILRSANELGWNTVAIYTDDDGSHATYAKEAVKLESVDGFLNAETIAKIATSKKCTHLHPGYGFLSESPALPLALAKAGSVVFIGPCLETLQIASDKMLSRNLATSLGVKVAPGLLVNCVADIRAFAQGVGYPVIIKALDGGGGRGIRVVDSEASADEAHKRTLGESPSKQVFVEQALTGPGWKHIEVQIIGDGISVNHLWERECSVQRRFQKIVEMAPSLLSRQTVRPLIEASLKLAGHLKYKGLGTFEYLFNTASHDWVFLEINPRVQVEHTVTEEICDVDLVRTQLLLFTPGTTLSTLNLASVPLPSSTYAIQLRLTAEDPARTLQLSPGSIAASDVSWPAGRGVRVDTWLTTGPYTHDSPVAAWAIGTDFDSLLAKIIVRGRSFIEATDKARSALRETSIGNGMIKTNIPVLAGVSDHPDWASNNIDTLWLERNLAEVLRLGEISVPKRGAHMPNATNTGGAIPASAGVFLQPGTLFNLQLSPTGALPSSSSPPPSSKHSLTLASIEENAFPSVLSGVIRTSFASSPLRFSLSQSTSAAVSSSSFELADLNDGAHVSAPMTGKIVELHPALLTAGDRITVRKGEALLALSVMKMENAVLAPFDAVVERLGKGIKVGVVLGEGMLVCVLNRTTLPSRL
ncbi:hypothetical protein HYPSUDRAFT_36046 [Hypholoma sublateritium FD-334 SS-4]|uniref:Carbamoyl phosphate synthase ATP-binding domain-containing protein n=1 Tax=Hypholoma sublateritium (strain FD-334 SS-4) TaxID=945553 RepID=A0A0D2Q5N0_HYPSF|nr:hypothetical protein HYPSUDRAFT_36046 [Hypholoma sublateritium FD-334 SS-4]